MLSGNIYNNPNQVNFHLNIKQQQPIAYHHLHKYYNHYILAPPPQLLMPSLDNNNLKLASKAKPVPTAGINQQQSQKPVNGNNIFNSKLQPLKNFTKVKELIARHNSQTKEEKLQVSEIDIKKQEKKSNVTQEQVEYIHSRQNENKLIAPKYINDKPTSLPVPISKGLLNGSKDKMMKPSTIDTEMRNRVSNPEPSITKPTLQAPRIHVYAGINKKPRFKTMHVEPSVVREAAIKVDAAKADIKITAAPNSLTKVNVKQISANDSDYSTQATDESKKDPTSASDEHKSDTIDDYLIAEREIKNFYSNLNQITTKSTNKTYDSSNSFKSSMNSFVSNFSHEKQQQKIKIENSSLIIGEEKLTNQEKQQQIKNEEQSEIKTLMANQAIHSTSDYSSFNSQLSNNFSKVNANVHEKKSVTPTLAPTTVISMTVKTPSPSPLQNKFNKHTNDTNKQTLRPTSIDINNKNFNDSDYKKYFDNLISNKDASAGNRGRKTGQVVAPISFKSPVRMIRLNFNSNKTNNVDGARSRQSSNPPLVSRTQENKTDTEKTNREIVYQQNLKTENEINDRKINFITNNNTKQETTANSSNQDKLQNIIKLLPKEGKNLIAKTKFVKLAEKGIKSHQLPPPPPTVQVNSNNASKSKDNGETFDAQTTKRISLSPLKRETLVLSNELLKANMSTDNLSRKEDKIVENKGVVEKEQQQEKVESVNLTSTVMPDITALQHTTCDTEYGEFKLPISLIKNIEQNIIEKNIERAFENAKRSQEEQLQKQSAVDPNLVQQKIGTLYAPKRKQRNGLANYDYIKTVNSTDATFSTTEDANSNSYMNKVNLPNIDGIDYYYRNKNDNKLDLDLTNLNNFLTFFVFDLELIFQII